MIDADRITVYDDGTAWWVLDGDGTGHAPADVMALDGPCDDGCDHGSLSVTDYDDLGDDDEVETESCECCGGTGRRTFEIEVNHWQAATKAYPVGYEKVNTHRVSVSEVLPIFHNDSVPALDGAHFVEVWDDGMAAAWRDGSNDGVFKLPDAARPGMIAVRLAVQS